MDLLGKAGMGMVWQGVALRGEVLFNDNVKILL